MNEEKTILESQIREIYGRVIYTHKTHEKCADILVKKNGRLKMAEIVLSAITTTSILTLFLGEGKVFQFVAAICSTSLLGLTLYSKNYDLTGIAEKHKQAAIDILEIRESLFSLLVDLRINGKELSEVQLQRDALNKRLVGVYKAAPQTNSNAYNKASVALKKNEEFTLSDDEVDKFLTESLRRNK